MRVNLFLYSFIVVYYEFSKISPPPLSKNIEDITTMDYIFRLCDNFLLNFINCKNFHKISIIVGRKFFILQDVNMPSFIEHLRYRTLQFSSVSRCSGQISSPGSGIFSLDDTSLIL